MAERRAVVVGAGIGGLTVARALADGGWEVTVCERAPGLRPAGSGLAIAPNALRGLDVIGEGEAVRERSALGSGGIRSSDGRWLIATDLEKLRERFGDTMVIVRRSELVDLLARGLPDGALRTGTEVVEVDPGDEDHPARVRTAEGTRTEADLVVAADGIDSVLRRALFPAHPGPAYSGFTAWRLDAPGLGEEIAAAEVWGRGLLAGAMPLADGSVYAYFTANAAPGQRTADERAELLRRFGSWHDPIPRIIAATAEEDILRNDVWWLREPLPALHTGRVALLGDAAHAMTPNLGQGACQAIEDGVTLARMVAPPGGIMAGLAEYTRVRLPRTTRIVRRSARAGGLLQSESRLVAAVRDTLIGTVARCAPGLFYGAFDQVFSWSPPQAGEPGPEAEPPDMR
ncbi:MAG: FAD-dependent monooxygenase [Nocardiopsaceae bacterium]|nr:FAD-dependent monooxygenase [Nocardiopsaceae bacterium]